MFGLSIDFQNGMSWSRSTKTQKLVCVLGNGSFPDQGPAWGAHGAGLLNQQYDFFAEETLKILVYFMLWIKSYSIFAFRQTHWCTSLGICMGKIFLYMEIYTFHYALFLHLLCSLTLFIKDNWSIKVDNNCIWTWAPIGSDCLVNCATTTAH